MIAPAIPHNEKARLTELRSLGILDSLPEDRFDRLTRIAARVFSVPIALVSLVDERRQWFKSRVGLEAEETAREISFCGHAILGNDVCVVADTALDSRFADNPLVVNDPKIHFYAGCPLKVNNGHVIGTLCIIDRVPREFSQADRELLADLAGMVEQELCAIELATIDGLTKLPNRRGFLASADKILSLCKRHAVPMTMAFFDLNGFKTINDQYGHAEGDRALVAFAGSLGSAFRAYDSVARFGGDEFVALLTGATHQEAEMRIADFRAALLQDNVDCRRDYKLAFSCGLVEYQAALHGSIADVLAQADSCMYDDKMQQRRQASVARTQAFLSSS